MAVARSLLRPLAASARVGVRALSSEAAEPAVKLWARVVRFEAADTNDEHFGVLSDDGATARIVTQGADGKTTIADAPSPVSAVRPPVEPSVLYGVGLNYRDHAAETGMESRPDHPVVFLKATSTVIGHDQLIVVPRCCSDPPEVDYEGELAVVIGKPARNVSKEDALSYVLGYTIANDVTARRWQGMKGGKQWARGKSFDTFCPLGPVLVHPSLLPDPQDLHITTRLNGDVVQSASTSSMVHSVAHIISHLSQGTTLPPGTVILTGTPSGVGYAQDPPRYLRAGDIVEVEISGIGTLRNRVAEETDIEGELRV